LTQVAKFLGTSPKNKIKTFALMELADVKELKARKFDAKR